MEPDITSDTLLLLSPFLIFFVLVPALALLLGDSDGINAIKSAMLKMFRTKA